MTTLTRPVHPPRAKPAEETVDGESRIGITLDKPRTWGIIGLAALAAVVPLAVVRAGGIEERSTNPEIEAARRVLAKGFDDLLVAPNGNVTVMPPGETEPATLRSLKATVTIRRTQPEVPLNMRTAGILLYTVNHGLDEDTEADQVGDPKDNNKVRGHAGGITIPRPYELTLHNGTRFVGGLLPGTEGNITNGQDLASQVLWAAPTIIEKQAPHSGAVVTQTSYKSETVPVYAENGYVVTPGGEPVGHIEYLPAISG